MSVTLSSRIVAVYGSLRRGHRSNGLMEGCKYVGQDVVRGRLYSLGAFPALKLPESKDDKHNHSVVVDLYAIPEGPSGDKILEGLDWYEGYKVEDPSQSLYRRVPVETLNLRHTVLVYEYNSGVSPDWEIPHGDWSNHENKVNTSR